MIKKEEALDFTKSLLADLPECEMKYKFITEHTDDGYFWPVLRCFLVGLEIDVVKGYIEKKPNKDDVGTWMLDVLNARLQDKDELHRALVELQSKVEEARKERDDYENCLQELQKVKLENKNIKQSMSAKDHMIKQLQDKVKSSVPTVGTENSRPSRSGATDLSLEAFKAEVLLNEEFSPQQRDYLFSLVEKGEPYSQVRMIAAPSMRLEDMKRFYQLINKKKEGEKKSFIDIAKGKLFQKNEED